VWFPEMYIRMPSGNLSPEVRRSCIVSISDSVILLSPAGVNLPECSGTTIVLVPEPVPETRRRPIPASGVVPDRKTVHTYGTPRVHQATHQVASVLTNRAAGEAVNQIFYSQEYAEGMRERSLPRGCVLAPAFCEWLFGVEAGWTSTKPLSSPPTRSKTTLAAISMFTGCGLLDSSLAPYARVRVVCEFAKHCRKVLRARMRDGHLRHARFVKDAKRMTGKEGRGVDLVFGGFPCQDIAISGHGAGFKRNSRSSLFRHMVRVAVSSGARAIFMENSPNVLSPEKRAVLRAILRRCASQGYTDIVWILASGLNVGLPQYRTRWFCLAAKPNFRSSLQSLVPPAEHNMHHGCNLPDKPPLQDWLLCRRDKDTTKRLSMMGNAVVPNCANLAFRHLVHAPIP